MKRYTEFLLSEAVDSDTVEDLELYILHDGDLYREKIVPAIENVKRRLNSKTYDHKIASKLWMYTVDEGVRRYSREFDIEPKSISKETKEAVAKSLADHFHELIKNGEYGKIKEAKDESPSEVEKVKDKNEREKRDIEDRQAREIEDAQRRDFQKKQDEKRKERQERDRKAQEKKKG